MSNITCLACQQHQKITWHDKGQEKIQSEETKQASETDSDMTKMLKVSDKEFKIIMTYMSRAIIEIGDNIQDRWVSGCKLWLGTLRKSQKEMLEKT